MEEQEQALFKEKLQEMSSSERERLKQILRTKLVQCGWRDDVKATVAELIRARGVDNVTAVKNDVFFFLFCFGL